MKKVGLEFRAAHLKANNVASTDAFSAYSFDGWLVFAAAAKRALATTAPYFNPRRIDRDSIRALLDDAFFGRRPQ